MLCLILKVSKVTANTKIGLTFTKTASKVLVEGQSPPQLLEVNFFLKSQQQQ